MYMAVLQSGEVVLPSPTSINYNNEIIWSSNSGRSSNGTMIGDVIAEKKNFSITWGILTQEEMTLLEKYIKTGFYELTFNIGTTITATFYRGSLSRQPIGMLGDGIYYYKSASVDLIQK